MHYATYGFMVFGIIQIVTVIVCLIKPSIILTRDLRFELTETRRKNANLYFALRMAIFALFGAAFIVLASPLVPDQMSWSMQGTRTWTNSTKAPWLALPLVLEFAALIGLNRIFTGRIFSTERNDFPDRKWLYIINACIVLVALLLWNIPSTLTVDKTMTALIIEDGAVVGETTVTADFELRDYLFRRYDECEGSIWVGEPLEDTFNEYFSSPYRYDYEYNGEKVTVYDLRYNWMTGNDYGSFDDSCMCFLINDDASILWIEEYGEDNLSPRSYIAYEGTYAEAAEVYDTLNDNFDSDSFVGLAEGYNPFR